MPYPFFNNYMNYPQPPYQPPQAPAYQTGIVWVSDINEANAYPMYYDDGGVEPGRATSSYARGRRNAPRDSMGRYSGYSMHSGREAAEQIRALMHEAPDEETRREMERLVNKLDR